MKELKIIDVENNNKYLLKDAQNNCFELFIEFYEVEKPKINDIICINKDLLNPSYECYSQPYAFCKCDKKIEEIEDRNQYIVLQTKNDIVVLKRIFG